MSTTVKPNASLCASPVMLPQQPNQVTAAHYRELYQHYSEEQVVELLAIVCLFRWLNCWNDTMATELETMPLARAGEVLADKGWHAAKHA